MLVKSNAYPPLANVQIPVSSRVLNVSCCPDKDLLLLVSRLGGLDRISLWHSNSGAKVWEADLGEEGATVEVKGIAWSPDGRLRIGGGIAAGRLMQSQVIVWHASHILLASPCIRSRMARSLQHFL